MIKYENVVICERCGKLLMEGFCIDCGEFFFN